MNNSPRVFISYSWSSEVYKATVLCLAEALVNKGIDVILDRWDLQPGHDRFAFMEQGISKADKVLILCDKKYADKANARDGGVGTETAIITPDVYGKSNQENCKRDFTYIDDIVEGVYRVMQGAPDKSTGADGLPVPPYAVYNIGGGTPENLLDYISTLQEELVRAGVLPADYDFEGHRELVGMQPGDVPVTYADSAALERDYGFTPRIGIREGLRRFAEWYAAYSRN